MNTKRHVTLLMCIIGIATFLRVWQLSYNPTRELGASYTPASIPPGLFPDEAMNGTNAYEAIHTRNFKIFYRENNGREGLFINLQALSILIFGNTIFALRIVSALFGIGTVLALYLFARVYTLNTRIALLASFLLATSFWHVGLSRLGFRANMAPFFATVGLTCLYYVWNHRRDPRHARVIIISAIGGLLFGLGFHSYIAYRIAPLIVLPILWLFLRDALQDKKTCIVCIPLIFIFFAVVAATPLLLYFTENPQDFLGRTSQISIFSQPNPIAALAVNISKTLQMFFFVGDFNWRHNYAGEAQLWWPVALFFLVGIIEAIRKRYIALIVWFVVMMLPVVLSQEGIPHALRAIVLIPPTFLFAAIGCNSLWRMGEIWIHTRREAFPDYTRQLRRIQKELALGVIVILLIIGIRTTALYFFDWGVRPETARAFEKDLYDAGYFLAHISDTIPKYVITDEVDRIDITGAPMALEPILYATNTYLPEPLGAHNVHYITPKDIPTIDCSRDCVIVPIHNSLHIARLLLAQFPTLQVQEKKTFMFLAPQSSNRQ